LSSNIYKIEFKNIKEQFHNCDPFNVSSSRISALLQKDISKCKRNKSLLIVQFLVPIIQIMMFCLCIGRDPANLNIGIYDEENLFGTTLFKIGEKFIENLDKNTFKKVTH
jgi:hypothetical protein